MEQFANFPKKMVPTYVGKVLILFVGIFLRILVVDVKIYVPM